MMVEYEYSFIVTKIQPYIEYCDKTNFKKIKETYQLRELFESKNKILARITTEKTNKNKTIIFDFKDENDSEQILKKRRESMPLNIISKKAAYSILEILEYKKLKTIERIRKVYNKENVTFEIDEYIKPKKAFVIAIEGEKKSVDKIYEELKILIDNASKK